MKRHRTGVYFCDRGFLPTYVCYCPDAKAWEALQRYLGIKDREPFPTTPGRCTTYEADSGKRTLIVTIDPELPAQCSPITLAELVLHEAVHVWQGILDHIGEEGPSPEFEAYGLSYVWAELMIAVATHHQIERLLPEPARAKPTTTEEPDMAKNADTTYPGVAPVTASVLKANSGNYAEGRKGRPALTALMPGGAKPRALASYNAAPTSGMPAQGPLQTGTQKLGA